MMTKREILDLYFLDARSKLIDIAAFLDRLDRAEGETDFRESAFLETIDRLQKKGEARAKNVLLSLSDPTTEPASSATMQGALGAYCPPS